MDLYGEIDDFAEEALAAYDEAEKGDPEVVLLNFGSVGYINSMGIALIVGLLAKARVSKRSLLVCGLSKHYAEIYHTPGRRHLRLGAGNRPGGEGAVNKQSAISGQLSARAQADG
jgi:ABC-type transporter Mla MlaB component